MKKFISRAAVLAIVLSVAGFNVTEAQNYQEDPRYGDNPEDREDNFKKLSYLKFEMDAKGYDQAAIYLKELMDQAPMSSSNIYVWGATIYKNKAARAKSLEDKIRFVDSVMLVYDRRAEYYGSDPRRGAPYILALKARDYLTLNPIDREGVGRYYRNAIEAAQGGDPQVVLEYFQQLVEDFKGVQIQTEELLAEYERLNVLMANATEEQKDTFNTLFASSGAANCDVLEELYAPQIAATPDDLALITKAYGLMSMVRCTSDFYMNVAEKYYALSPSSATAIRLASLFEDRQEYEKALKYLAEMLPGETDPAAKADLYVRVAASELRLRRGSAAANAAREAIALNPNSGYAQQLLAEAYVAGQGACSGFESQTVSWLAYDQFARARSVFEAQGMSEDAQEMSGRMADCRVGFPSFEDGFMYIQGYEEGKSYTVRCGWVSGTTTIRSK